VSHVSHLGCLRFFIPYIGGQKISGLSD
jgi:hypothetical protein